MLPRSVLSILAGVITSAVLIYLFEALGHMIYPPPSDLDTGNVEAMKAMVGEMPLGASLMVILAWAVGAFGGGFVSARVATKNPVRHTLITAGILIVFSIMNLVMIPHPIWFSVLGLAVFVPAAYAGGKLAEKMGGV